MIKGEDRHVEVINMNDPQLEKYSRLIERIYTDIVLACANLSISEDDGRTPPLAEELKESIEDIELNYFGHVKSSEDRAEFTKWYSLHEDQFVPDSRSTSKQKNCSGKCQQVDPKAPTVTYQSFLELKTLVKHLSERVDKLDEQYAPACKLIGKFSTDAESLNNLIMDVRASINNYFEE